MSYETISHLKSTARLEGCKDASRFTKIIENVTPRGVFPACKEVDAMVKLPIFPDETNLKASLEGHLMSSCREKERAK